VKAPTSAERTQLAQRIAQRIGRLLERQGLLERDAEITFLSGLALEDEPMEELLAHSGSRRPSSGAPVAEGSW